VQLKTEIKELRRRLLKADRGFLDCNKLYQQTKKDNTALIRDVESLGSSFEDMQEQNVRLLQTLKEKDEQHNEMLRQRTKEKNQRDILQDEKRALKEKLDAAEALCKARSEETEKGKQELDAQRQEISKRAKEDELGLQEISKCGKDDELGLQISKEHAKVVSLREHAAKDSKREAERAKATLAEHHKDKSESLHQVQEMKYENNRLTEELERVKRNLTKAEVRPLYLQGGEDDS
ncbi:hypothetical protein T484DRAFT_1798961, partial [Baffinella frigidus]